MRAFQSHYGELQSDDNRANLAKMILKLFDLWDLDTPSQLILLGLSPTSRAMLTQYRNGKPLPLAQDILDRAAWLLVIHQALRSLYSKNPEICYTWIKLQNSKLDNFTPLDFMKNNGLIGLAKIGRFLQSQLVG